MSGPAPKATAVRRRRNKAATSAVLPADDGSVRAPKDAPVKAKATATGVKAKATGVNKKAGAVKRRGPAVKKQALDVKAGVPGLPRRMEMQSRFAPVLDDDGKPVYRGDDDERIAVMTEERFELERPWHELALAWWAEVWRSPMASEFYRVDVHRLYIIADLVDRYWWAPAKELAAEIRLQERAFGLDPMARRSLQWEAAAPRKSEEGRVKSERAPVKRRPKVNLKLLMGAA